MKALILISVVLLTASVALASAPQITTFSPEELSQLEDWLKSSKNTVIYPNIPLVNMGVQYAKIARPEPALNLIQGLQHSGHADLAADEFSIPGRFLQGNGGGAKHQVVEEILMAAGLATEMVMKRKSDLEIDHRQQPCFLV